MFDLRLCRPTCSQLLPPGFSSRPTMTPNTPVFILYTSAVHAESPRAINFKFCCFICPSLALLSCCCFFACCAGRSPDKPVLVFVASRRQTRLTALDLISLCTRDANPRRFVRMPEEEAQDASQSVRRDDCFNSPLEPPQFSCVSVLCCPIFATFSLISKFQNATGGRKCC